jgi:hypothetical protein
VPAAVLAAHLWVDSQTNQLLLTQQSRLCCQQVNGALQFLEVVDVDSNTR